MFVLGKRSISNILDYDFPVVHFRFEQRNYCHSIGSFFARDHYYGIP